MRISATAPSFATLTMPKRASSVSNVTPQDSIRISKARFQGESLQPKTETAKEKKGVVKTLFGSPLKNIGWAVAWGAAGAAAFMALMPPLAMGLYALSALHVVGAGWQFFTKEKKPNNAEIPIKKEVSPSK